MLSSIFIRIKHYVHMILVLILRSRIRLKREEYILLDLTASVETRTIQQILIPLQRANHHLVLRLRFVRHNFWILRLNHWLNNLKVIWSNHAIKRAKVLVTDHAVNVEAEKIVHIAYDYTSKLDLSANHFVLPYSIHYRLATNPTIDEIAILNRNKRRSVRIFFAGNYNPDYYDHPIIRDDYGKLTRHNIITQLRNHSAVWVIKDEHELANVFSDSTYHNQVIIIDTTRFRLDQTRWLDYLANADFFVAPPGVLMPMCHNIIEAMAVGTIPITNYPDWFLPEHLENMVNCISFSSPESLINQIEAVLSMDGAEIELLRANTIAYYKHWLSPSQAINRLLTSPSKEIWVHVLDEFNVEKHWCETD